MLHQKNAILILCWRPTSGHTRLCFMCFPCRSGTSNVLINGPGAQESAHCASHPHFVIHWCHKRPQDTKWWSYNVFIHLPWNEALNIFSGWSDVRVSFPALGEEDSWVYFGRSVRGGTMTTGVVGNGFITGLWPFMSRITLDGIRDPSVDSGSGTVFSVTLSPNTWPVLSSDDRTQHSRLP